MDGASVVYTYHQHSKTFNTGNEYTNTTGSYDGASFDDYCETQCGCYQIPTEKVISTTCTGEIKLVSDNSWNGDSYVGTVRCTKCGNSYTEYDSVKHYSGYTYRSCRRAIGKTVIVYKCQHANGELLSALITFDN